jgi:carboxymethylenebutenolidase
VEPMQEYLVTEFIEEYEDGNLSRPDLEHRIRGILGPAEGDVVLAGVPLRTAPARSALATPARSLRPVMGGAGLKSADVKVPVQGAELLGYLAQPESGGPYPGIIAIHENQGLVEHTRDCARRLASAGYVVFAPDLLSREGGSGKFADRNDAIAALGKADAEQNTADLVAALDWLAQQPGVESSRLGVTGWCMGGGYTWRVVTQAGSRLRAAVPWYGPNPPSGVDRISAHVFAIYGELDQRINAGIDAITEQMRTSGKSFEKKIYPGAGHAFNNDTNAERYSAVQAPIAWADMLAFFRRHL